MVSVSAPELVQGADEDLLLAMGDIIFPGFVKRREGENGLCLWVEGNAKDGACRTTAAVQFQTLLGVLRAWPSVAGATAWRQPRDWDRAPHKMRRGPSGS
jgi:hypothetical protein